MWSRWQGRVGDVMCGLWGVAVEGGVRHRRAAAVPADDVEDGALGADAGDEGVQPAGGSRVGCAINGVLQGDDADDEDTVAVDVKLAVDDGDRLGQRMVVTLGPRSRPLGVHRKWQAHHGSLERPPF